tara:strand:+ start:139 stop:522 length:384 start_codon:yes stop_codon:yes gene_type:complete
MKKLIYLFLTVLIVGCSGDDSNSNQSQFNPALTGSWYINFLADTSESEADINISSTGVISGEFNSLSSSGPYPISGNLEENGVLNATINTGDANQITLQGELETDGTGLGVWVNSYGNNGNWDAVKN